MTNEQCPSGQGFTSRPQPTYQTTQVIQGGGASLRSVGGAATADKSLTL